MNNIDKILTVNYQESGSLISLIRKYDLENFLNGTLKEIEKAISESDNKKLLDLSTLSLIKINENLKGINSKEKEQLEFLLSEIFQSLMKRIDKSEIITEIQNSLLDACRMIGYDYNILEQMLGLKKIQVLKNRPDFSKRLPYYIWLGKDYKIVELFQLLKDKKLIYSIREFKKIFAPINEHFEYIGYKEKISELVLVFSILNEKKLIKTKVQSGHFSPLKMYGVDNEGKYLFKKAPNKIHEYIKRDKDVYAKLYDKYEKIISNIASKTIGQIVDNGR
jgi:hypothetical protein